MYGTEDLIAILMIVAVFVFVLLLIFRSIAWWWLGIGDRLNEAKRTNELLAELIALQQSQQQPRTSPVMSTPQPQSPPLRNPLTHRP